MTVNIHKVEMCAYIDWETFSILLEKTSQVSYGDLPLSSSQGWWRTLASLSMHALWPNKMFPSKGKVGTLTPAPRKKKGPGHWKFRNRKVRAQWPEIQWHLCPMWGPNYIQRFGLQHLQCFNTRTPKLNTAQENSIEMKFLLWGFF